MRGRDQTRDRFQQLRDAQDRTNRQIGAADGAFACRSRDADLLLGAAEDENGFGLVRLGHHLHAGGAGLRSALRDLDFVRFNRGRGLLAQNPATPELNKNLL